VVQAERREWVQAFTNHIEASVSVQEPLLRRSRNLGSESEVLELLFAFFRMRCLLIRE
jgi:hypothetical protein